MDGRRFAIESVCDAAREWADASHAVQSAPDDYSSQDLWPLYQAQCQAIIDLTDAVKRLRQVEEEGSR